MKVFDLITYDMVKNISHGEELKVNDEYVLYHYTEDDLIVLVKEDEWEEVATILYNDLTQSVEFEIY